MELNQVGKYQILGKIGQGAMGQVFKAYDPVLGRSVAIKMMSVLTGVDPDLRQRFQREAQSAARLNHPNIITIYDFGEEDGVLYMAMELLEGSDLKDLIGTRAIRELTRKLDLMEQVCEGLSFAHAMEIVHRDLKPANIHVQHSGQVKIMDFGLARLGASQMTRAGMVLGTPHYMSPEQVKGEPADTRSDVFSLGAVFYELLSNHRPFDAESLHVILYQVLETQPAPVRQWVPTLPQRLVDVVDKALAKNPAQRYQNAGELKQALLELRGTLPAEIGDQTLPPGERSVWSEPTLMRTAEDTVLETAEAAATAVRLDSQVPRVSGAVALDRSRAAPSPTPIEPAMLLERAPAKARLPLPEPRSRLPLYVGAGLLVAALGVGTLLYVQARGRARSAHPAVGREQQVGVLTEALVVTQVELARESLEHRNYAAAVVQAEKALQLDPERAEAKSVLEKARQSLADLDSAAGEAEKAFASGDMEGSSQALSRVLSIDPRHPVVDRLSKQLNSRFQSEAEDARRLMREARRDAERLRANSLPTFAQAAGLGRDADAAFAKAEFAVATRKFLESRNGFEQARRGAEAQARRPLPPPTLASVPSASVAPQLTLPPVTLPPPTMPPAATLPPATLPPATLPHAPSASDEPAIRRLIGDYGAAIERKDLGLFRSVKPNLSAEEEKRLRDAFKAIQSQQVNISVTSVRIDGSEATVRVARQDTINGKALPPVQQVFRLVKGPAGWSIQSIGQ